MKVLRLMLAVLLAPAIAVLVVAPCAYAAGILSAILIVLGQPVDSLGSTERLVAWLFRQFEV